MELIIFITNIRPEIKEDYSKIYKINKLAFKSDEEPRLVEAIRKLENFIPELSLVAIKNDKNVGHILFSPITIESKNHSVHALAPIAVLPEFQNQGIGSELVKHGLKECKRMGHKIIILFGHPNYYPRFGFSSARAKGLESPFPVSDEVFMVIELVPNALDGISGMVNYSSAFDGII